MKLTFLKKIEKFLTKEGGTWAFKEGHNKRGIASIRLHWHNSIDRPGRNVYGMWMKGFRAWLYSSNSELAHMEWKCPANHICAGIYVDPSEGEISLATAITPIWISFGIKPPYKWFKYMKEQKDISIVYFSGSLSVSAWYNAMVWSSRKKCWEQRHWTLDIPSFFFGDSVHTERDIENRDTIVSMPEGNYPVHIKLFESTWKRPRSPFVKRILRADIAVKDNELIPFPGKGENSWDCGMDGISRMTTTAKTVEDAVSQMVRSVLKYRRKRGGIGWLPKKSDVPNVVMEGITND